MGSVREEITSEFLTRCKAHIERKFWIERLYSVMLFHGFWTEAPKLPRALRSAPHLDLVARYWMWCWLYQREPTADELRGIIDDT